MYTTFQNSETDPFGEIFRKYYKSLRAYAYRYVGDFAVAEDIVQDVFMQFWKRFEELSGMESHRSYLFTCVYNGACNFLKHKKVVDSYMENALSVRMRIENLYQQRIFNRSDSLLVNELEDKIEHVMKSLPDSCKRVFILSRKKNLKNKEIAELLEIDLKTVEKHMTKALSIMRERLKEYL